MSCERFTLAALLTVHALAVAGAPAIESPTPLNSWQFNLTSGSVGADTGLTVSFTRAWDTIDPTGTFRGATSDSTHASTLARFDRAFRLSPVGAPVRKETTQRSWILGAGVDADGTSPRMIYLEPDALRLSVYTSDSTRNSTTLISKTLSSGVKNAPNGAPGCLRLFEDTGHPENDHWLTPVAGIVFHGAVIVAGPALVASPSDQSTTWTVGGWGFMISQDAGATWDRLWDDLEPDPQQSGMWRGREWCLKACPAHNRGVSVTHPLEFWVTCTDYVGRGSPEPQGGRVYVARMARSSTSDPWVIDHDPALFQTFNLDDHEDSDLVAAGCHAHSAYLVEYGQVGDENKPVQLIVSLGDEQSNNRLARFVWDGGGDPDFTTNWTETDNFHGRRTTASPTDLGSWSFQPVGVAGGPLDTEYVVEGIEEVAYNKPSLIWGGDVHSEWLNQTVLPLPGADPDQLTCNNLWGWDTGFGSSNNGYLKHPYSLVGTITESSPDTLGPLVATVYDTSGTGTDNLSSRILYLPSVASGSSLGAWHQLAAIRGGVGNATAVIFNGALWFAYWDGTNPGLYRMALPTDAADYQPMVVSPGGKNLVHEDYLVDPSGQVSGTPGHLDLKVDGSPVHGVFMDSSKELPPCPTMATHAWKIVAGRDNTSSDGYLANVHVSSNSSSTWNGLSSDSRWSEQKRIRRYRAWVLDNSFGNVEPNKTIQLSSRFLNVATVSSTFPNDVGPTRYSSSNRWCPVTLVGYHDFTQDGSSVAQALGVQLSAVWSGAAATPDDNNFYFVVDSAMDSFGSLPYPIAHSTGSASTAPDELLTITKGTGGPSMTSSGEWTLRVGGLLPEGDWDQYAQRIADNDGTPVDRRYWPLFTLWASNTNYIEFRADCVNRRFDVKTVFNSTTSHTSFGDDNQVWTPNAQFYGLVSFNRTTTIIGGDPPAIQFNYNFYFGASLAGGAVAHASKSVTGWPLGVSFTELRFRGGPNASSSSAEKANEVVTMRWVGGQIDTGTGAVKDSDAEIEGAFADLDWLP